MGGSPLAADEILAPITVPAQRALGIPTMPPDLNAAAVLVGVFLLFCLASAATGDRLFGWIAEFVTLLIAALLLFLWWPAGHTPAVLPAFLL